MAVDAFEWERSVHVTRGEEAEAAEKPIHATETFAPLSSARAAAFSASL